MGLAVLVEIGNKDARIIIVLAARSHYNPAAVAAPGVVAVGIFAVGRRERAHLACLQILDVKVGILVPNMKLPVVGHCEEHVAAVGADAGHGDARAEAVGIDERAGRGEAAGLFVEVYDAQAVVQAVVDVAHTVAPHRVGHASKLRHAGGAIHHALAVGRPAGEGFQLAVRFEDIGQRVLVGIEEHEVRAVVDHFNLLAVHHVERLSRLVGREDHPVALGVPRGVDGGRKD